MNQLPPITKNLLIINVLVYLAQLVFGRYGVDLTNLFGLHFILASDFKIWQLVTYMFLHGGIFHLFFNMFSLWMFGRIIEQVFGPKRFLLFYFVCGVGAGLMQELFQFGQYGVEGLAAYEMVSIDGYLMPKDMYLNLWTTIGASGACYGVLLAFGMTFPNERIMLLIPPIPLKAKYFVIGYAAIELFSAFSSGGGNIAHFAHLGGMLFGWLLILYWRHHQGPRGGGFTGWENYQPPRRKKSHFEDFRLRMKGFFGRLRTSRSTRKFKDRTADYDYNARKKAREERIDHILDKVKRSGYDSLTAQEKKDLFDYSNK